MGELAGGKSSTELRIRIRRVYGGRATAAIGANESRFCAVVAESPFATFREVAYARFGTPFHAGPWLGRTFFWPAVEIGFLYVREKFGLNMELVSPADAVAHSNVPVFLIHGLSDVNIPAYHSLEIQS